MRNVASARAYVACSTVHLGPLSAATTGRLIGTPPGIGGKAGAGSERTVTLGCNVGVGCCVVVEVSPDSAIMKYAPPVYNSLSPSDDRGRRLCHSPAAPDASGGDDWGRGTIIYGELCRERNWDPWAMVAQSGGDGPGRGLSDSWRGGGKKKKIYKPPKGKTYRLRVQGPAPQRFACRAYVKKPQA